MGLKGQGGGEPSSEEFALPTGHLRNTLSKQIGLGLEFKRKVGSHETNVGALEPTQAVRTVAGWERGPHEEEVQS